MKPLGSSALRSSTLPNTVTTSIQSATISTKDKYGRKVIRRVIRPKKKPKSWLTTKLPQIVTPHLMPKQTNPLPDIKPVLRSKKTKKDKAKQVGHDLWAWIKDNAGIIILNAGSICTLTAFTRSDILELRCLSMTGSLSSVIYFVTLVPKPKVMFPAIWSSIFALTNAYKVFFILEERNGKPKFLTAEEEFVYGEHFMPHGVTPRQFEKMIQISKVIELKKGDVLLNKGKDLTSVYLVKTGSVDGVTGLKRRVTAASRDKNTRQVGGDSGAWIGELSFLNVLAAKDIKKTTPIKPQPVIKVPTDEEDAVKKVVDSIDPIQVQDSASAPNEAAKPVKTAILSYIATEDSTVYEFEHEKLTKVLQDSADMRAAVTRVMTAAVVGKVVNLYVSKVDADKSLWQKWLEDNWQTGVSDSGGDNVSGTGGTTVAATEVQTA